MKTRSELIRIRCKTDIELFAKLFFPHHCRHPFNEFHKRLFKNYKQSIKTALLQRKGYGEAIAAPRGNAKSTINTLILPIHSVIYQIERYIVIISATIKQATQRLDNIRSELITNEKLKIIFGNLLEDKKKWNKKSIVVNDVRIDALSAGTEIRGITYKEFRPTRIIIDDGEDSESVENPDLREKLSLWFSEVVENLGDTYTIIVVIGTLLHQESLLAQLLKRPDYKSYLYHSILSFSQAQDLWNKWQEIYTDLHNEKRIDEAYNFYLTHKNEMLNGTKVLWQHKEDYYNLMCQMVSHGRRSFFKEKQNEPRNTDIQIFDIKKFKMFEKVGNELHINAENKKVIQLQSLEIYGFLDPALGHTRGVRKKGDYAAIATIGKDSYGYIYVLDIYLGRISPMLQITRIFDYHKLWKYASFGIETNCFQEIMVEPFEQERTRRRDNGEEWLLPLNEVKNYQNKESRILGIEPLISNGWILFNKDLPEEFFQQCEQFPTGRHDDGIDALSSAVAIAKTQKIDKGGSTGARRTIKSLSNF